VVGRESWDAGDGVETGYETSKKPQTGREYGLFCAALYSWWAANNLATCLR